MKQKIKNFPVFKKMNFLNNKELKYLQLTAIFMIALVVTIPVYSASVFAGIDRISVKGSDGVKGFVKEQDHVNFVAIVSADNDTVTKEQVWLGQNFKFDSCTPDISGFKCSLRYPADGTTDWESRAIPYTINLKKDGSVTDSKSGAIYVDNLAPAISSFSADPAVVNEGSVELKYSAEDKACLDASCSGKCSGIKSLELYEINGSYSEIVKVNESSCGYSSKIIRNGSVFGEGKHTIYAKAYDALGRVSNVISTVFSVDNSAPQIDAASFKITDDTGLDMPYASPQKISVKAYIEINEPNLDKDSVVGDFTSVDSSYKNLKATCSETVDGVSKCTWPISLAVTGATSHKFVITAKDLVGNDVKEEVTKDFNVDTAGPVVTSIKTDRIKDSKSYAKLKDNTIIADITEDVGLDPKQVVLHLDGKAIKANNCSTGWTCTWNKVDISSGGTLKASIGEDTTDRLGNKAAAFAADITVDSNLPKLVNLTVLPLDAQYSYIKTGDSLQIKAILEDESVETAYADLSSVITDANDVEADSCVSVGSNKWQCSWATIGVDISGHINDYIYLKFKDTAGNVLEHKEAVEVYGLTNGSSVNYWTHKVKCSPKLIDRQTTSLINQKVFCHVKLEPLQDNIIPLSVSLGSCSNDTTAIQLAEVLNDDAGSRDPYIKFTLKKSKFDVDAVDLNCQLHITTKIDKVITATPEEEEVAVKLEFYNMPLGEISDGIKNKIQDALDDANEDVLKIMTTLKEIAFYAEKICRIISIVNNLAAFLKGIGDVFSGTEAASAFSPYYGQIREMRKSHDYYTEEIREGGAKLLEPLNKFCKFVNCQHADFSKDNTYTSWMGDWRSKGFEFIDKSPGAEFWSNWGGKDSSGYMNPKDSLVVSVLTGCIPGIIHNLDKWRQVQCMYAHCLQEGVKQQGLPVIACEDQKDYAECKYIAGEIFNAIPFTAFINYYAKLVKSALSDPLSAVGIVLGYVCKPVVEGGPWAYPACAIPKIMAVIGGLAGDITSIIDEGFKIKDDYCDKLTDEV